MNAILYNGDDTMLTEEEVFKEAEEIIKNSNKKKSKKWLIITICIIVFLLIMLLLSTIFALINSRHSKIISGVSILGIDVSNLTIEEAKEKINNEIDTRLNTDLIFSHNEQLFNILPSQLEWNYNVEDAVNIAYSYGREGNIFKNNYDILGTLFKKVNIDLDFSYNEDLYNALVEQLNDNFEDGINQYSYEIDGTNLIITPGKSGYMVVSDELKNTIINKLTAINYTTDSIEIPVELKEPDDIDVDKIHEEIYKEAVDAYYTKDPFAVYPSSTGIDFNISIDEAKAIIANESETYTIPLKILYPSVTTNDIGMEAFPDLLASYYTSYATSSSNRSTNIALAASKINGTVLMPGEEFSFNGTVGQRTASAGFKVAGVYVNGESTTDYGGGICQVSSTLYNAVLKANLEITNRSNHMFTVRICSY